MGKPPKKAFYCLYFSLKILRIILRTKSNKLHKEKKLDRQSSQEVWLLFPMVLKLQLLILKKVKKEKKLLKIVKYKKIWYTILSTTTSYTAWVFTLTMNDKQVNIFLAQWGLNTMILYCSLMLVSYPNTFMIFWTAHIYQNSIY